MAAAIFGAATSARAQPEPVAGAPASAAALSFDLPGIEIGAAEYLEGPTGALEPVGPADFTIAGPRADRLRFDIEEGRATGLTINPGRWPVRARRLDR